MAVKGPLLVLREVTVVGVDVGGVLHGVLGEGDREPLVAECGFGQGDEALVGAEESGVDGDPFWSAGLVIEVEREEPFGRKETKDGKETKEPKDSKDAKADTATTSDSSSSSSPTASPSSSSSSGSASTSKG